MGKYRGIHIRVPKGHNKRAYALGFLNSFQMGALQAIYYARTEAPGEYIDVAEIVVDDKEMTLEEFFDWLQGGKNGQKTKVHSPKNASGERPAKSS